jgi:hypothetical protein
MSRVCLNCKQYQANGGTCFPRQVAWKDECRGFRPRTFFHRIADSVTDLAHYLVYNESPGKWCSTVVYGAWKTYDEAIAATVAKLKEVCND